jgi:hypothetical protein
MIIKNDDENKYVAEIKEITHEAKAKRFDDYYNAREWITHKINEIYRDFDEIN